MHYAPDLGRKGGELAGHELGPVGTSVLAARQCRRAAVVPHVGRPP